MRLDWHLVISGARGYPSRIDLGAGYVWGESMTGRGLLPGRIRFLHGGSCRVGILGTKGWVIRWIVGHHGGWQGRIRSLSSDEDESDESSNNGSHGSGTDYDSR
jgi:hypothetical protein